MQSQMFISIIKKNNTLRRVQMFEVTTRLGNKQNAEVPVFINP